MRKQCYTNFLVIIFCDTEISQCSIYSMQSIAHIYIYIYIYIYIFMYLSIVSISMSSDHRGGSTIRFSFHPNNQTLLYCWI